ncbi:transcription factor BIM1-like isoform X1 [Prosopis cineraria]|uniref:transcription factor BIM1-like isoform X1 n=1 Tax=Prosopis cineraria TaxID=364024 RepID=UPI00240EB52F|nr:transcription factor BIM1-like isoform X1 [Prosopis cineraria]
MARSARGQQQELEDDDEDHLTGNGSSSLKVKVDEATREQRVNAHRSKHSETEQRRRSKINERFQILRDLIPQNDQKRDKASFLLEVIEYIQFLQEKLQMYEQSYQGWNQEPMKLIPWRNHRGPTENVTSQAMQNGSGHENNDLSPSLPLNAQNAIESDLSPTIIQKAAPPGLASEAVPLGMQMRLDMFDAAVSSGIPTQHFHEAISNSENTPSHTQPQVCLGGPEEGAYDFPNNTLKEQDELAFESESVSISRAYSQGILDTFVHALRSSGVDLSEANVSVQIDLGRRSIASTSSSKDHENQFVNNPAVPCSGVDYCSEDSEQALKRLRTEAS